MSEFVSHINWTSAPLPLKFKLEKAKGSFIIYVSGGRHSRVDVKMLTLSLLFGFLRSPCVHFIHQNLNSVEKIFFLPPLNVDASFFSPLNFVEKFSRRTRALSATRASHFMLQILRFWGTDFISIEILWFGAHRGLFSALALVSIRSLF